MKGRDKKKVKGRGGGKEPGRWCRIENPTGETLMRLKREE